MRLSGCSLGRSLLDLSGHERLNFACLPLSDFHLPLQPPLFERILGWTSGKLLDEGQPLLRTGQGGIKFFTRAPQGDIRSDLLQRRNQLKFLYLPKPFLRCCWISSEPGGVDNRFQCDQILR